MNKLLPVVTGLGGVISGFSAGLYLASRNRQEAKDLRSILYICNDIINWVNDNLGIGEFEEFLDQYQEKLDYLKVAGNEISANHKHWKWT